MRRWKIPSRQGWRRRKDRTYGKLANWGFDNSSDLDTGVARNAEIYQWNLGVQHLLPGQIVIAADYAANRATHLPWAGASVSTRERNFLPSSIREALVASTESHARSGQYGGERLPRHPSCQSFSVLLCDRGIAGVVLSSDADLQRRRCGRFAVRAATRSRRDSCWSRIRSSREALRVCRA